jgi:hypothetical protein
MFVEDLSFNEICLELDIRKKRFEDSWRKWNSPEEVWSKLLKRNNTFLTSK